MKHDLLITAQVKQASLSPMTAALLVRANEAKTKRDRRRNAALILPALAGAVVGGAQAGVPGSAIGGTIGLGLGAASLAGRRLLGADPLLTANDPTLQARDYNGRRTAVALALPTLAAAALGGRVGYLAGKDQQGITQDVSPNKSMLRGAAIGGGLGLGAAGIGLLLRDYLGADPLLPTPKAV